jgi:hypothetical protein
MREQWRYFQFGENRILALPPDAYGALTVWVHYADGSIQREHLKPACLPTLTELTEEQARLLDPVMFCDCLERPYDDAPTLMAFYKRRYKEELAVMNDRPLAEYHIADSSGTSGMREGDEP